MHDLIAMSITSKVARVLCQALHLKVVTSSLTEPPEFTSRSLLTPFATKSFKYAENLPIVPVTCI